VLLIGVKTLVSPILEANNQHTRHGLKPRELKKLLIVSDLSTNWSAIVSFEKLRE
jgi:hypothetical protein